MKVIVLASWLVFSSSSKAVGDQKSAFSSMASEYGSKTANLFIIEEAIKTLENLPVPVLVPSFVGISSLAIHQALKEAGFHLEEEWKRVVAAYLLCVAQPSPTFFTLRNQFENHLVVAFNHLKNRAQAENLSLNDIFYPASVPTEEPILDVFLTDIFQASHRLMVRSTGQEDDPDYSHAGGNESVFHVEPTTLAVLDAIQHVVVSYFKEKSILQRWIVAGKAPLIEESPLTPILLQKMIREEEHNPLQGIPASGVMFTQDPEMKDSEIILIQATYGYNLPAALTDTYYMVSPPDPREKSPFILSQISPKKFRFKSQPNSNSLVRVQNPKAITKQPSLNTTTLRTLYQVGKHLEKVYNRPLDIEFVVQNGNIYLVQARPLIYTQHLSPPSFVRDDSGSQSHLGETTVAAGNRAIVLENNEPILFADSIEHALLAYGCTSQEKRAQILAIIVRQPASRTSHAATIFRGAYLPVVSLTNALEIQKELKTGKKAILDTQTHRVLLYEQLPRPLPIEEGYKSYPMTAKISFFPDEEWLSIGKKILEQQALEKLHRKPDSSQRPHFPPLSTLLRNIQEDCTSQNLALIEQIAARTLTAYGQSMQLEPEMLLEMQLFLGFLHKVTRQLIALENRDSPADHIKRLFLIKTLHLLFYEQNESSQNLVHPLSFAFLLKVLRRDGEMQTLIQKKNIQFRTPGQISLFVQLSHLRKEIYEEPMQKAWDAFLRYVAEEQPEYLETLAELIVLLDRYGILSEWLNTSFTYAVKEGHLEEPSQEKINHLISPLLTQLKSSQASESPFLQQLSVKKQLMGGMNLDLFTNEADAPLAWEGFLSEFITSFINSDFVYFYQTSHPLLQSIARSFLLNLVNQTDDIIKAMKGSHSISLPTKLPLFNKMLNDSTLLIEAIYQIDPQLFDRSLGRRGYNFAKFLSIIKRSLSRKFVEEDLMGELHVDTSAFAPGVRITTLSSLVFPSKGEDLFSLIHQSLLSMVSLLGKDYSIQKIGLPTRLREVLSFFGIGGQVEFASHMTSHIGTTFFPRGISLQINATVGCHGYQAYIDYSAETQSITLRILNYGPYLRKWIDAATYALLLEYIGGCQTRDIAINGGSVSFTLQVSSQTDLSKMKRMLPCITSIMEDHRGGNTAPFFHLRPLFHNFFEKDLERALDLVRQRMPSGTEPILPSWAEKISIYAFLNFVEGVLVFPHDMNRIMDFFRQALQQDTLCRWGPQEKEELTRLIGEALDKEEYELLMRASLPNDFEGYSRFPSHASFINSVYSTSDAVRLSLIKLSPKYFSNKADYTTSELTAEEK